MARKIVHLVGTGTIGEPLIGLLSDYSAQLGVDEITFNKNTPLTGDRSKVSDLIKRGARLSVSLDAVDGFKSIGLDPDFTSEEAIERASVVIDCTPKGIGHKNKLDYYDRFRGNTLGFVAQGSETGFGKMYARGINDESLVHGEDQYIQVISCNTHSIAVLIQTLALQELPNDNLVEGRFVIIRRANDISQDSAFIPSPQVGKHIDEKYGSHHARDCAVLFATKGLELNLFSSAMKVNSQYMHVVQFNLTLKEPTSLQKVIDRLDANDRIALTEKSTANQVFSFGRDHGHYGRILNQVVVAVPTLQVRNGHEIIGFAFTPQDGNALLSSISITEWFLYPHSFEEKIQCLKELFFNEV
jgi:glyceraldehyde-3-phosphate dehydrogenase (NAD(P))